MNKTIEKIITPLDSKYIHNFLSVLKLERTPCMILKGRQGYYAIGV